LKYGARILVTEEALPQVEIILGLLCQRLYVLDTLSLPRSPSLREIHVAFYGNAEEFAYQPGVELLPLARIATELTRLGLNIRLEKVALDA